MKKYILLLVIAALAIACTKEESGLNVSITGFVSLVDTSGVEVIDKKDVTVNIHGASTSTKTDKYGKFLFSGLKAGAVYSFDYSKEGYGRVVDGTYRFVGDQKPGLARTIKLYQQPKTEMLSSTISCNGSGIAVYPKTTRAELLRIFGYVNDSPDVSDLNYDYCQEIYSGHGLVDASLYYDRISLANTNYKPGTTVYVAIYFLNYYDQGYYDLDKNMTLYSSAKKAGVLKITI